MKNNRNLWIITIATAIVMNAGSLLIAQMGTMDQPGNQTSNAATNATLTETATEKAETHNVTINNFAFSPQTLTIKKADTVVWTNLETVPHIVISYGEISGATKLKSPKLSQEQTYTYVFNESGKFPYRCDIHPAMKGTIIVENREEK